MQLVRPELGENASLAGLNRAAEFGFIDTALLQRLDVMPAFDGNTPDNHALADARSLPSADRERLGPNTDLIGDISTTVGKIVLGHATGRHDSHTNDRVHMASGLSALGNILTQKARPELLKAKASAIEASKHPLSIDSILYAHAAYQDAIRRSAESAMFSLDSSDSEEKPAKKRENKAKRTPLLGVAIARAYTDTN